jgi:anti-sigma regulatory factor (Ser/Thr protein kinase)
MMPELSLNILDVAQNSVTAGATLVEISVTGDRKADLLTIVISDNGCGMTPEQVRKVTDPFYTTRTTRSVGLGVPFFKMAAEMAGGSFQIESTPGAGTITTAVFQLSHIDRMPLGDLAATMTALIGPNPDIDFVLSYKADGCGFDLDTREFKAVLGDVKLGEPEILAYIDNFVQENIAECGDLT